VLVTTWYSDEEKQWRIGKCACMYIQNNAHQLCAKNTKPMLSHNRGKKTKVLT